MLRRCHRPGRLRYEVAKNDRTVQPVLQRFVAQRMGATTYAADGFVAHFCEETLWSQLSLLEGERLYREVRP